MFDHLIILSRGQTLVAACLLLACCSCCLRAACCCLLLLAAAAAFSCCFLLLLSRSPCLALAGGTGGRHQQREGMFLAGWNETLRSHSAVVSLCSPSTPSRTISQDGADGKTAQDGARRRKTSQDGTGTTDGADGAPTKPATLSVRNGMKGFIPTRNRWADRTTNFLRAVRDLDAHRASHRFGCGKQEAPISLYQ